MAVFIKKNNQLQPVGNIGTVVKDTSLAKSIVDKSVTLVTAADLAGITSIGTYAFYNCRSLTSITVPNSVTSIGQSAFSDCIGLTEIHFRSSTPATLYSTNTWSNLPSTCKIYVPIGSLPAYTSSGRYPDPNTYQYIEE